ncbi:MULTISPECIES: CaiB/BaiF CoA transferase family protein [Bradyrhizobium]|uniref:CoA transferase n=1 Tax=Bradyrhizobium diazoefficiens TaxID=1355477 RepID=A0A810CYJ9_9BRAD|nr:MULTISPECIES: CaiB/BaiF CoA-transferase family protein [Bradyrhizobium]MDA9389928.1 CoA-transferase [Bradyrhizobium sp. CCBAU 45394]WLA77362.1 CaiB/BaiF CoA-transferase family protein [Bradyrhizobium diazoefficiens]BCE23249.1 CoA transferase [Bradyrhizobium diazoefficiens]BCE49512.1 CoA transferase [Bradyrhizobium diazoefficiens]BCE93023.1 CoA transferase [Bradyrhizobium diazoefficiens]
MSALPLSGIKILDLTRVLAGPLSAQMLGDLGAEVIKIERPGTGDDARAFGPPYLTDPEGKANNNNSFYLCANRNKKSVTVNIAKPEGQAIIRELAKDVDVFMENYKVGDLKRYGLDYETIKAINPGIIYCSVTGFGQTGPYAPRAGYDAILQAMGGLMSVTGHIDGEPGEGPMKVGPSIVDYMTGMNSSIGILSALYHRDANGGVGQHLDVCLLDTVIASLSHWLQIYLVNGKTPPRRGTWGNGGMPAGVFRCTDGELMLVVGNDGQFQRTCAVLGEPELANDKRFIKNNDRVVHGKEIMAIFAGLFLKQPVAYWLDRLEEAGVPSGPINNFEQVFSDPHVQSRGMRVKTEHKFEPELSLIRNALTFSETPIKNYRAPPLLGEHTKEVLGGKLGYDAGKIETLKQQGII